MKPSKLVIRLFTALILLLCAYPLSNAFADSLGPTLSTYAVLGGTTVTNVIPGLATDIGGDLGVSTGTSITGFPPGTVAGGITHIHSNDGSAATAQGELTNAFNSLGALGSTGLIGAGGLSNTSLGPGVYDVTSSGTFDLSANSKLTLTGTGVFVFRMSSSLNADSAASVDISGLGAGSSVYWVVPTSSAVLGSNVDFAGNILSGFSITFDPGATDLCGRALAKAAVTFAGQSAPAETGEPLEANAVGGNCSFGNVGGTGGGPSGGGLNGGPGGVTGVPEPATNVLLLAGILSIVLLSKRFITLATV